MNVSDSVAINGVCLTLTRKSHDLLLFDCVKETLNRSTLGDLRAGSRVNLELALGAGDPLGGHFVQGHVDGIGRITSVEREESDRALTIEAGPDVVRFVVEKGSIAVDGVSLTIARMSADRFTVKIVPFTWGATNLADRRTGDAVNLETDILAKYIARFMTADRQGLTEEFLRKAGF